MNRTAHYGLPLFEATDKPSILVDWNETMADLDEALFTLATGGDSSVADAITALQQAVSSINTQIATINQTLGDTLDTTFMNNIAPQFETTGVEYNPKDMVFHNKNLYICFSQYTGLQDDEEHFDQYFIPVWLANKVTDNLKDVDNLKTRMTSAESGISTNTSNISGLDSRVTVLENAPSGNTFPFNLGQGKYYSIRDLVEMGVLKSVYADDTLYMSGTKFLTSWTDNTYDLTLSVSFAGETIPQANIPSILKSNDLTKRYLVKPISYNIHRSSKVTADHFYMALPNTNSGSPNEYQFNIAVYQDGVRKNVPLYRFSGETAIGGSSASGAGFYFNLMAKNAIQFSKDRTTGKYYCSSIIKPNLTQIVTGDTAAYSQIFCPVGKNTNAPSGTKTSENHSVNIIEFYEINPDFVPLIASDN